MILDLPVVLDYGPAYEDYNNRIIKTLQQMTADGRKRATIKSAVWTLRTLNRHVDIINPEAVKLHIANLKDKNVDDLDLEKLGKLIQQAIEKSSEFGLRGLFKNLKRS